MADVGQYGASRKGRGRRISRAVAAIDQYQDDCPLRSKMVGGCCDCRCAASHTAQPLSLAVTIQPLRTRSLHESSAAGTVVTGQLQPRGNREAYCAIEAPT